MKTTVEWIRADERLPYDGAGIVAAVTGRYHGEPEDDPDSLDGKDFWLVLPMYFRRIHPVEDTGTILRNVFFDSDAVVRLPLGRQIDHEDVAYEVVTDEVVTHWAHMPNLPGANNQRIYGDEVQPALRAVLD